MAAPDLGHQSGRRPRRTCIPLDSHVRRRQGGQDPCPCNRSRRSSAARTWPRPGRASRSNPTGIVPGGTVRHTSMHRVWQPVQSHDLSSGFRASGRTSDRLKSCPSPMAVKQTSKHQWPADALPQPALELDAEADLEVLFALDDGVLRCSCRRCRGYRRPSRPSGTCLTAGRSRWYRPASPGRSANTGPFGRGAFLSRFRSWQRLLRGPCHYGWPARAATPEMIHRVGKAVLRTPHNRQLIYAK